MAKARPIPGLSAEEPYAAAAAKVVAVRSQELADHSRDVLGLDDIERVHDMRVATRRLRAALEVFEACFPKKAYAKTLAEVKELADALGERRDRDVTIAALGAFGEGLTAPDRRGIETLVAALRHEQQEANEALRPYVAEERVAGLRDRLRELIAEAEAEAEAEVKPRTAVAAATLAREAAGNGSGAIAGAGEEAGPGALG